MMGRSKVPPDIEGSVMAGGVRVTKETLQSTVGDRSCEALRSTYRVLTSDLRVMKSHRNVLSKGVTTKLALCKGHCGCCEEEYLGRVLL